MTKSFLKKTIHSILQPFNIIGRREWFYFQSQSEINYAKYVFDKVKEIFNQFDIDSYADFKKLIDDEGVNKENSDQQEYIGETNINKLLRQQSANRTGKYKGVCWCVSKNKWKAELKMDYKIYFLGYYSTDIEASKAYNDYALYLNENESCSYSLNDINEKNYTPIAKNIPQINTQLFLNKKTSKYNGVRYYKERNTYYANIKFYGKTYFLGSNKNEEECAKLYNKQAAYFNQIDPNASYRLNIDFDITPENILKTKIENLEKNKSSFYRGLSLSKQRAKWKSIIVINRKQKCLGFFYSEIDAALAYNKCASEQNELKKEKGDVSFYKLNTMD